MNLQNNYHLMISGVWFPDKECVYSKLDTEQNRILTHDVRTYITHITTDMKSKTGV